VTWRKSTESHTSGCVEVAFLPDGQVGVRNSRDPNGPPLEPFTAHEWDVFIEAAKRGEFDGPIHRSAELPRRERSTAPTKRTRDVVTRMV